MELNEIMWKLDKLNEQLDNPSAILADGYKEKRLIESLRNAVANAHLIACVLDRMLAEQGIEQR